MIYFIIGATYLISVFAALCSISAYRKYKDRSSTNIDAVDFIYALFWPMGVILLSTGYLFSSFFKLIDKIGNIGHEYRYYLKFKKIKHLGHKFKRDDKIRTCVECGVKIELNNRLISFGRPGISKLDLTCKEQIIKNIIE